MHSLGGAGLGRHDAQKTWQGGVCHCPSRTRPSNVRLLLFRPMVRDHFRCISRPRSVEEEGVSRLENCA